VTKLAEKTHHQSKPTAVAPTVRHYLEIYLVAAKGLIERIRILPYKFSSALAGE